jgi:ribosomal protein S18 acetylase RimI-like enzyme
MVKKTFPEVALNLADLTIRQVTRADLPALEWEGEYWMFREMFADLFRNSLAGRTLMWVVVEPMGELIGQAFVMLKSGDREAADGINQAYVFSFRVKEKWRKKGIGSHLMGFVEADLLRRGFKYVTLNVAKDNQVALRLYKRLGYHVVSGQPGIWSFRDPDGVVHHVKEPAWRMKKNLVEAY